MRPQAVDPQHDPDVVAMPVAGKDRPTGGVDVSDPGSTPPAAAGSVNEGAALDLGPASGGVGSAPLHDPPPMRTSTCNRKPRPGARRRVGDAGSGPRCRWRPYWVNLTKALRDGDASSWIRVRLESELSSAAIGIFVAELQGLYRTNGFAARAGPCRSSRRDSRCEARDRSRSFTRLRWAMASTIPSPAFGTTVWAPLSAWRAAA
jgi:hypothetical protein